jgi:ubiquinone/menaquinone biosynthesis C-methylase UbiE
MKTRPNDHLNDPTQRFSNRVADYVKYRPQYPEVMYEFFLKNGLKAGLHIADIGSGTGISSAFFLKRGFRVSGIEPNEKMREAAEKLLGHFKTFKSIDGTAENTHLNSNEVDHVIAGQAFHWFDPPKARQEFQRIMKPDGCVFLMWNDRDITSTAFLREYEALIEKYAFDYSTINHQNLGNADFDGFFGKGNWKLQSFPNYQHVDFEGFKGRLTSSSYIPDVSHANFSGMIEELKGIFDTHKKEGKVTISYSTNIYYGRL